MTSATHPQPGVTPPEPEAGVPGSAATQPGPERQPPGGARPAVFSLTAFDSTTLVRTACVGLLACLCLAMVWPLFPAFAWALAAAIVVHPLFSGLVRRGVPPWAAAAAGVLVVTIVIMVPAAFLARAIASEAREVVRNFPAPGGGGDGLRAALERGAFSGPLLAWLQQRFDVAGELAGLLRTAASWASSAVSTVFAGSLWALGQAGMSLFALFFFLRDGDAMLGYVRRVIPLDDVEARQLLARVAQTIRAALGGKVTVACIQGSLGGLIFHWLDIPAPVLWGVVMAALSLFPVIGSFLIWIPAAAGFAMNGNWRSALLLTVWGVAIIHPVDNLLGPWLVGAALRVPALAMFVAIVGGMAAFGAAGIVLGPMVVAISLAVVERAQVRRASPAAEAGF